MENGLLTPASDKKIVNGANIDKVSINSTQKNVSCFVLTSVLALNDRKYLIVKFFFELLLTDVVVMFQIT